MGQSPRLVLGIGETLADIFDDHCFPTGEDPPHISFHLNQLLRERSFGTAQVFLASGEDVHLSDRKALLELQMTALWTGLM